MSHYNMYIEKYSEKSQWPRAASPLVGFNSYFRLPKHDYNNRLESSFSNYYMAD